MIFYFSGTGNSYSVAKRIAEALGDVATDMASAVRYGRHSYDAKGGNVGFVFPVYFYGLPSTVKTFAEKVSVANPGRVFCVATCGEESGGACEMLREILADRLKTDASYDIVMPDNSVFYCDPPSKESAEETLKAAEAETDRIIESVKRGDSGDMCLRKGEADWREFYAKYEDARTTEPFRVTDACIECRICEEVCPDGIIRVYHRKPVWDEDRCSMCMACVQMCPKRAVQWGEATVPRGRYYNPAYHGRTLGIPSKYLRLPAPSDSE